MARIVSGVQDSDPNAALMSGFQLGSSYRRARQDRADEERANQKMMMDFMQAQAEYQREEAQALAKANQGQMDARALAAVGDLKARAQAHPKMAAKMLRAKMANGALGKLAERGVSEDTIQRMMGHIADVEKTIQQSEERQAATQEIQRAVQDQVPGSEMYESRIQAGEKPEALLQEISSSRIKRAQTAANAEMNQEALTKIQGLIQAAPPGQRKSLALTMMKEYEMSPSRQGEADAGAKLLQNISQTLLGTQSQYDEDQLRAQEKRQAAFTTDPMPGLGGMSGNAMRDELGKTPTLGMGGPDIPAYTGGTHATLKAGKKSGRKPPKRAIIQTVHALGQIRDPAEMEKALREQGLDLEDPDILTAVEEALGGGSGGK